MEWLSHDWDVMVYVGSNEEAWVEERDEIRHGYTWVYALSPLQEDANCLGGHINTDQLMSLRAWQKKTAIDWLKKMKMPEYVIQDFETTGQVYVSVMGNYREFRTPNVVVKKKIAAFEKRRNNLVYLVIRDRALDINYFAYVTGDRSGDGNLQEQKDCVRYDSLSVYEIFPGRGYVNQYYETSLSFNRSSNGEFVCFTKGW